MNNAFPTMSNAQIATMADYFQGDSVVRITATDEAGAIRVYFEDGSQMFVDRNGVERDFTVFGGPR